MAKQLNLTHFVDDKPQNIDAVDRHTRCQCIMFICDGTGAGEAAQQTVGAREVTCWVVPNWYSLLRILLAP